jgi:hypothetical protein
MLIMTRAWSLSICLIASASFGQGTRGANPAVRPNKKMPQARPVPMYVLLKSAGFRLAQLPLTEYVLMNSEMAVLPKGFLGKLKSPQNVVLLTYGSKKGGIIRIYEMNPIPPLAPEAVVRQIAKFGIFRDVNRNPAWTLRAVPGMNLIVVPTSTDSKLVTEAIAHLTPIK